MNHTANYKIYFRNTDKLPEKLAQRYVYNDNIVYVAGYEKTFNAYTLKIWNRTEGKNEIYEYFDVPTSCISRIEEISYKTQYIPAKKHEKTQSDGTDEA